MAVQVIQPEKKKSESDMFMDMGKEMAMSYGKQKMGDLMNQTPKTDNLTDKAEDIAEQPKDFEKSPAGRRLGFLSGQFYKKAAEGIMK
jgi:hypothetical protein